MPSICKGFKNCSIWLVNLKGNSSGTGNVFVADPNDLEKVAREKEFWNNIRRKLHNKKTINIYNFISRGPQQDMWINNGVNYVKDNVKKLP